jgi:hypothetical protein
MGLPAGCLNTLRAAGLLVTVPAFPPGHIAYPDGCVIYKPHGAGGNCLPVNGYYQAGDAPIIDAPRAILHAERGKWIMTVREGIPLPGPGDFTNEWDTPEQAVADILDYFFGDPARMLVKRHAREEELRRLARMPHLVSDYGGVLAEAACVGDLLLVQQVVTELRQLVRFGADAEAVGRAIGAAAEVASSCGRQQVAQYLEV